MNASLDATERLATRVRGGSVVFFIGAGFSIDSEGNTAKRLVGRLLARLLALGASLEAEPPRADRPSEGRALLDALGSVFGLEEARRKAGTPHEPARCMTGGNLDKLAREYYSFNEWTVSALGLLSRELLDLPEERRAGVIDRVHRLENFLLRMVGDRVPLERIGTAEMRCFDRDTDRGKALFLDTMGFANRDIMAGMPPGEDLDLVASSYGERIRPRHHALARLAREGLLPCLVTTNYDSLLEGAYRLAGFQERSAVRQDGFLPPTAVPSFSRVAGPAQFFGRGDATRTALLLKIHGCVDNYRVARTASLDTGTRTWAGYLPSLVFTYREIQTWRADAWSRDFLRTLLRTNTLALCGYSGADPVMHNTFREVYEEMAGVRPQGAEARQAPEAPLYFFDIAGKREFHGLEILRAATEAIGHRSDERLTEHPNRVEFQVGAGTLPTVDDSLRWLVHTVMRQQQVEALRHHLRRVAALLLGHPCPDAEFEHVRQRFERLTEVEKARAHSTGRTVETRRAFERVVGWTWHFLPGFLRECALGEHVRNQQGPGRTLLTARRGWWYFPASERPEWTAWAAVVELALREMVARWRGVSKEADGAGWQWIAAEDSPYATISFSRGENERQPLALSIRLAGFARNARSQGPAGAYRRTTGWEMSEDHLPWTRVRRGRCPAAETIWRYVLGKDVPASRTAYHLGAIVGGR